MTYQASIRPNVVVPFHRWTTSGPRQLNTEFGPDICTTDISAGPLSFMFSRFTIQNFRLQFNPTPFVFHSIKQKTDQTQFSYIQGGTQSVRGIKTSNLFQIFKGVVTLYSFSPFQFTIRHTTVPCLIKPV